MVTLEKAPYQETGFEDDVYDEACKKINYEWDVGSVGYEDAILKLEQYGPNAILDDNYEGDETKDETSDAETNEVIEAEYGAEWTAFMGHIAHTEIEYLKSEMGKLKAPYVMAAETAGYEHFHFLAKITKKQYHAFTKKVFIDKYKLHGRWYKTKDGKNHPRQYGKVKKEIRDLSKMMSYTLKDKNFFTNMKVNEIEFILKKKIEECENTKDGEIKEKMIKYVDKYLHERFIINLNKPMQRHQKYIRIVIIRFLMENKCSVLKNTIERFYYYYVTHTELDGFKLNEYAIYDEIYDQLYA